MATSLNWPATQKLLGGVGEKDTNSIQICISGMVVNFHGRWPLCSSHSWMSNWKLLPMTPIYWMVNNCSMGDISKGSQHMVLPTCLSSLCLKKIKREFLLVLAYVVYLHISKVQRIVQDFWNYNNRNANKCLVRLSLPVASNHIHTLLAPTCLSSPLGF